MLRDAKKFSHHKEWLKGEGRPIGRVKNDESLDDLPQREHSRPRSTWREGGGLSWHAIKRWLGSRVGKEFHLSEAPKEWRGEIESLLRLDKRWFAEGVEGLGEMFLVDDQGILRQVGIRRKWRSRPRPPAYVEFEGEYFVRHQGLWFRLVKQTYERPVWSSVRQAYGSVLETRWVRKFQVSTKLQKILTAKYPNAVDCPKLSMSELPTGVKWYDDLSSLKIS